MEAASEIQVDDARAAESGKIIAQLQASLRPGDPDTPGPDLAAFMAARQAERENPKRGRPKRIDGINVSLSEARGDVTPRQGNNLSYAFWAATALIKHRHDHPEVLEFTGGVTVHERGEYPGRGKWKIGPLTELGRLRERFGNGEEYAVKLAVELARMRPKPTSKEAVAYIRNFRLGAEKREPLKGTQMGVMDAVCKAVDAYTAAHPGTAIADVIAGIEDALGIYFGMEEEGTPEN